MCNKSAESIYVYILVSHIFSGKYGQDSERALIATRYNITVRVYDAYAHRSIFNSAADPSGERVIAIRWDRISTHYDLLIPEGDDFALNRSRQLQHILSRCSLQSQNPRPITQVPNGKPQCRMQFKSQSSQEEEEVDLWLFFSGRIISSRRQSRFRLGSGSIRP